MLSAIFDGSPSSFKLVIDSLEIFLFKLINFSNFLKIVSAKTSKSSFESIFSLTISVLQVK